MTQHYQYSESSTEPGSLLPSQFFDGRKKTEAAEPSKRLMLAVLPTPCTATRRTSIREQPPAGGHFWKPSSGCFDARADGPVSFENVCYVLVITPDYLRQMLRNRRARRLGGACVPVVRRSPVILVKQGTPSK
jgi:hypothetical protein